MYKIGFACKWIDNRSQINGIGPKDAARALNTNGTTISWLSRQPREKAEQKLWELMRQNLAVLSRLVERVGGLDPHLRMFRITSDLLPAYTHPSYADMWKRSDTVAVLEKELSLIGARARALGIRLSFHPGQFCVLASDNDDIVDRSILEFEYHTDIARWMGYGRRFQDMKINVHISGRRGPPGIKAALSRLSPESRALLTIENDEMTWGIESSIELSAHCALVLDIHHHWIKTGEYILPSDPRLSPIRDSWRGERPVIHYSVSREDTLPDHSPTALPDLANLLRQGHNKMTLRAHSDFYWNCAVNEWAGGFCSIADIMCESKGKNLASFEFAGGVKKASGITNPCK